MVCVIAKHSRCEQIFKQSCSVWKLFWLPKQPPYWNCLHLPSLVSKCQRCCIFSHGPFSAGLAQIFPLTETIDKSQTKLNYQVSALSQWPVCLVKCLKLLTSVRIFAKQIDPWRKKRQVCSDSLCDCIGSAVWWGKRGSKTQTSALHIKG